MKLAGRKQGIRMTLVSQGVEKLKEQATSKMREQCEV